MRIFISTSIDSEFQSDLAELLGMITTQADPNNYSVERRDWATQYQKILVPLKKAIIRIENGEPSLPLLTDLRAYIKTGIEKNLLEKMIRHLLPNAGQHVNNTPVYNRLRWLWKTKHLALNAWERSFVESVGQQLKQGKSLTAKQEFAVDRILAKYQVPFDATAADNTFGSQFSLGDVVLFRLQQNDLYGRILAIAFMPGKVLYTIACYTGFSEPGVSGQYGLVNSVGWEPDGLEYIRIPNVDSIYVLARASRIGCRCPQAAEQTCFIGDDSCPRKTPQFRLEQPSTDSTSYN